MRLLYSIFKEDWVWVNQQNQKLTLIEIDNRYLLNILRFIKKGGGYAHLINEDKILTLYNEAIRRGLKVEFKLKELITAFKEKRDRRIKAEMFFNFEEPWG